MLLLRKSWFERFYEKLICEKLFHIVFIGNLLIILLQTGK